MCDETKAQYNFLDTLTGKKTDDIINCINNVMETEINNPVHSSTSEHLNYIYPAICHKTLIKHLKNGIVLSGNNYHNYGLSKDNRGLLGSWGSTGNLVSCH